MQFEDPDWRVKSPGPMPDHAVTHFWYEAVTTIAKRGRALDILDAFMWRFSNGTARRTGDINRVEGQLSGYMHDMGKNAALFTEALAAAHADVRELGYDAPDLNALNDDLSRHYTGFHIDGDTLRQRRSRRPENEPVFHVPPEPPKPVVEFVAMKLADPAWAFDSPGIIPRATLDATKRLIGQIAGQADHKKQIFETFKDRFAAARGESSFYGSSSTSWAESDMHREMDDAAGNAPLFIAAFADGCSELREQKIGVPSPDQINKMLDETGAGHRISDGTIVTTSERAKPRPTQVNPPAPSARTSVGFAITSPAPVALAAAAKAKSLQVFLCHSRPDKVAAKDLHRKLKADGYDPWLDAVNLIPGQDWELEIKKAVRASDVVLVCLSPHSVNRAGFMQKEIKFALDVADEQPEGRIYIIPARLEECTVPTRLSKIHWLDLFESDGYFRLLDALKARAADA